MRGEEPCELHAKSNGDQGHDSPQADCACCGGEARKKENKCQCKIPPTAAGADEPASQKCHEEAEEAEQGARDAKDRLGQPDQALVVACKGYEDARAAIAEEGSGKDP